MSKTVKSVKMDFVVNNYKFIEDGEVKLTRQKQIMAMISNFVCSKKGSRTIMFAYALALHLLTFFTLWEHTLFSQKLKL